MMFGSPSSTGRDSRRSQREKSAHEMRFLAAAAGVDAQHASFGLRYYERIRDHRRDVEIAAHHVRLVVGHHQEIARADVQRLAAFHQPRLAAAGDKPMKENCVLAFATGQHIPVPSSC
jgi:hypothetical protein